jgi:hypothetical protein
MQFFNDEFVQSSTGTSVPDITAPTFAGISGLIANPNGSLRASWLTATDASEIRYEVYISTSNIGLFNLSNRAYITVGLIADIFTLANNDLLTPTTYYVGVRAIDSYGNRETNTVSLNEISLGVVDADIIQLLNSIKVNTNLIPALV